MKFKDTKYGDLTGQTYDGSIIVSGQDLTSLEGAPEVVTGYFECSYNKLTSLEGAPKIVNGSFDCRTNNLISLEGAPEVVGRDFDCSVNRLTNLKGGPKEVGGYFDCTNNNLISLEGAPKKGANVFYCEDNPGKHLKEEYQIRKKNPNLSEIEIKIELVKRGFIKSEELDGLQDIFFL